MTADDRPLEAVVTASIRPFVPADRAAVSALAPELTIGVAPWRPADGVARAAESWVEDAMAGADRPGRCLLVAELAGEVCGFVGVESRRHFSGQEEAYIGELVVAGWARRRGIARALVAAVGGWAAGQGLSRVTLETGCANEAAMAFYRALGFAPEQIMLSAPVPPPL